MFWLVLAVSGPSIWNLYIFFAVAAAGFCFSPFVWLGMGRVTMWSFDVLQSYKNPYACMCICIHVILMWPFWLTGLNMKVCVVMGLAQLLLWAFWAGLTRHPSRFKLWAVVLGGGLAMLLEIYDFPPYEGYVDAHALWHATTIPLTYLWWSFIKDDAEFRTSILLKKSK